MVEREKRAKARPASTAVRTRTCAAPGKSWATTLKRGMARSARSKNLLFDEESRAIRYVVIAPRPTSICPVTGQPDFGIMMIDYVPNKWLIESKSLKLYLNSFRNHGAFHEDCTVAIGKRVVKLLGPKWLRIGGYFYPRGGMPIDVFWQYGKLPKDVWVPDQGVPPYRARG